jgi:hypothetical protein
MGMINFEEFRSKKKALNELIAGYGVAELRNLTNEMVDRMVALVAACKDEDVVFVPEDPKANDPHAAIPEEVKMPWRLGHIIVHTTASAEESAVLAAELARGVALHGRSRYETSWQQATTIAMCRARLEESRRIRLASLEMWPDKPHLEVVVEPWPGMTPVNAVGRFALGLMHDDSHLEQTADAVRQAKVARG